MAPAWLTSWIRIHRPSITKAGTAMMPPRVMTRTRLRGKRRMYPPSTPLMAPDAPTLGTLEPELNAMWAKPAARPQTR
jgi:hypothetical protein